MSSTSNYHVFCHNRFSDEWVELFEKMCELTNICAAQFGDIPLWYYEQTITSLIASSAMSMMKPKAAMVETYSEKQKNKQRSSNGRLDLWIWIDNKYTWIESKAYRSRINLPKIRTLRALERDAATRKKAIADAQKVCCEATSYQSRAVFAFSYFHIYLDKQHYDGRRKNLNSPEEVANGFLEENLQDETTYAFLADVTCSAYYDEYDKFKDRYLGLLIIADNAFD